MWCVLLILCRIGIIRFSYYKYGGGIGFNIVAGGEGGRDLLEIIFMSNRYILIKGKVLCMFYWSILNLKIEYWVFFSGIYW